MAYKNGQYYPDFSNFNIPTVDADIGSIGGYSSIPDTSNYDFKSGPTGAVPAGGNTSLLPDWLNKDTMSTLGGLAQGAGSIWAAFNAGKQLDLAKDQFKFSKGAFNANFANQAKIVNSQLEDRQRARIGGTGDGNVGGNYESVGTYLNKNAVSGAAI